MMDNSPLLTMSPQNVPFGFGADGHIPARFGHPPRRKSTSSSGVPHTVASEADDLKSHVVQAHGAGPSRVHDLEQPSPNAESSLAPAPLTLVGALNALNRNVVPGPRSVPHLVRVARRVTTSIRAGSPFADESITSTAKAGEQAPSELRTRVTSPPLAHRDDGSSVSSQSRSSSRQPDLPSWASLSIPNDPSSESDEGEEVNVFVPAPITLLKIGPPRRAKPVKTSQEGSKTKDKQLPSFDLGTAPITERPPSPIPAVQPPPPRSSDDDKTPADERKARFDGVVISQPSTVVHERERISSKQPEPPDILNNADGSGHESRSQPSEDRETRIDPGYIPETYVTPPPLSSSPASPEPPSRAFEDLALAGDTREDQKQGQQISKARSSFLGVVITKPSPRKDKPAAKESQDLVSALAKAFANDEDAIATVGKSISAPTTYLRPATALRRPRNGIMVSAVVSLSRADIEAHLGTRVAPLHVPRPGGPSWADPEEWGRWAFGPGAAHRLRVCLRHVEATIKKKDEEENVVPQVTAALDKSRTRFFVERLNEVFGPGSVHRGAGPKPKVGSKQIEVSEMTGLRPRSGRGMVVSDSEEGWSDVMDNVLLGKRTRSVVSDSEEDDTKRRKLDEEE